MHINCSTRQLQRIVQRVLTLLYSLCCVYGTVYCPLNLLITLFTSLGSHYTLLICTLLTILYSMYYKATRRELTAVDPSQPSAYNFEKSVAAFEL